MSIHPQETTCDKCGAVYGIGQSPFCRDGHATVRPAKGFEPHFDIGLGKYVTGWGDVRQEMRRNKLDFRDHPSPGQLSARRDREEQKKRMRAEVDYSGVMPPASVNVDAPPTVLYDHAKRPLRRRIGF